MRPSGLAADTVLDERRCRMKAGESLVQLYVVARSYSLVLDEAARRSKRKS
jgi:hypothetical protein